MNACREIQGGRVEERGIKCVFVPGASQQNLVVSLSFCHPESNRAYLICIKKALFKYNSEKKHLKIKTVPDATQSLS